MNAGKKGQPTTEHPEFDPAHVVKGIVRRGLKPVPNKELISMRIDQDVISGFKAQGPGTRLASTRFCARFETRARPEARVIGDLWMSFVGRDTWRPGLQ